MKMNYLLYFPLLAVCTSMSAGVIVSESFGGSAANDLAGTSADVFDAGIVTAGGSATWVASGLYHADGSIDGRNFERSAFLDVGSYINDAKGTATGIFSLQATIDVLSTERTDQWVTLGFFSSGMVISDYFSAANSGNALVRAVDDEGGNNYFPGPVFTDPADGGDISGLATFKIVLDLSTHNNTDDFGTIAFFLNDEVSAAYSYDYVSDMDYSKIGFSNFRDTLADLSDFSLTQVPEPSTYALLLGSMGLVYVISRRRT